MKNMRTEMPQTAALIDSLRKGFGAELINEIIKGGINGKGTFYSTENGHEVGLRKTGARSVVSWDTHGRSFAVDLADGLSMREESELIEAARAESSQAARVRQARDAKK